MYEFCGEKRIDFTTVFHKTVMCHYLCKIVFFVQLLKALGELCSSIDWFHAMEI